eukprot:g83455.t1
MEFCRPLQGRVQPLVNARDAGLELKGRANRPTRSAGHMLGECVQWYIPVWQLGHFGASYHNYLTPHANYPKDHSAPGTASPGANYNLGGWTLQLPTGSDGNVDTASGSSLEGGFTKKPYFYTDTADGAMVMMCPSRGWATSGSQHLRVELRENKTWKSGTHQSDATLKVTKISALPRSAKFSASSGTVSLYMANSNEGGDGGVTTTISNVPLGTKFSYSLKYSANKVTATVNGASKTFTANSGFMNTNAFYFKAGNCSQSQRSAAQRRPSS